MRNKLARIGKWFGSASLFGMLLGAASMRVFLGQSLEIIAGAFVLALALKVLGAWLGNILSDPVDDIAYFDNGTVIGYKVLESHTTETVSSPIYPHRWKSGWNKAEPSYWNKNHSGFHAYKDPERAISNASCTYWFAVTLELAGKITVCEDGYRAEYARVVGILTPGYSIRRDFPDLDILLVTRKNEW
jgi:hypothetical protein